MHAHTAHRSLSDILYGHAPLRRASLAELSRETPVIVVFVDADASAAGMQDVLWLEKSVRGCARARLVVVHPWSDAEAEPALASHGLAHALRISDASGRLRRAFANARALGGPAESGNANGPFLLIDGAIVDRPPISVAA